MATLISTPSQGWIVLAEFSIMATGSPHVIADNVQRRLNFYIGLPSRNLVLSEERKGGEGKSERREKAKRGEQEREFY